MTLPRLRAAKESIERSMQTIGVEGREPPLFSIRTQKLSQMTTSVILSLVQHVLLLLMVVVVVLLLLLRVAPPVQGSHTMRRTILQTP